MRISFHIYRRLKSLLRRFIDLEQYSKDTEFYINCLNKLDCESELKSEWLTKLKECNTALCETKKIVIEITENFKWSHNELIFFDTNNADKINKPEEQQNTRQPLSNFMIDCNGHLIKTKNLL